MLRHLIHVHNKKTKYTCTHTQAHRHTPTAPVCPECLTDLQAAGRLEEDTRFSLGLLDELHLAATPTRQPDNVTTHLRTPPHTRKLEPFSSAESPSKQKLTHAA